MQINRLFETIYILLEHKVVTATELAEKFEVSTRTIYRDVETLSQAGIPIYMSKGKGGGISLLPDFILNKAVLTEQEKSDILSSMKAFCAVNLSKDKTALDKLSNMLGDKNSDWVEVNLSSWAQSKNDVECFEKIKVAVIEKQVITFMYANEKAEKLLREVLPLKLVFKGAAWYLYGFCKNRQDYRLFKLRRIYELNITNETFSMSAPEAIMPTWKIDETTFLRAEFIISEKMAFRVYDEFPTYKINENGDFVCELLLPNIDVVCNYAASFGQYCTISSPDVAIDMMKSRLEKTLRNYL